MMFHSDVLILARGHLKWLIFLYFHLGLVLAYVGLLVQGPFDLYTCTQQFRSIRPKPKSLPNANLSPLQMPRLRSTTTGSRARKSADSHSKPSSTRRHSLPESSIGDRRRQKLQRLLDSPMMQVEGMSWTRQRQREFVKSRIEAYGGTP